MIHRNQHNAYGLDHWLKISLILNLSLLVSHSKNEKNGSKRILVYIPWKHSLDHILFQYLIIW